MPEIKATVPDFSRRVYVAIHELLDWGEPGYSALEPAEVAEFLGCSVKAVNGALGRLQKAGLVWCDRDGVNGEPFTFIHTYQHDHHDYQGPTPPPPPWEMGTEPELPTILVPVPDVPHALAQASAEAVEKLRAYYGISQGDLDTLFQGMLAVWCRGLARKQKGEIYKCAAPDCPGYSWRASERPHPCGAEAKK